MAVLTVNVIDRSGSLDPVASLVAAAGGGDAFPNTGKEFVIFQNTGGTPVTVTEVMQTTVDGQTVASKTFSVPATTGYRVVGPYPTANYNDANARMNFTYSGVTGFKVGVFVTTTN